MKMRKIHPAMAPVTAEGAEARRALNRKSVECRRPASNIKGLASQSEMNDSVSKIKI